MLQDEKKDIKRRKLFKKEIQDALFEAIRRGAKLKHALAFSDVSIVSFKRIIDEAQEKELSIDDNEMQNDPHIQFLMKYRKACAHRSQRWIDFISDHAQNDWRAAQSLLDRIEKDNYGMTNRYDDNFDERENKESQKTEADPVAAITKFLNRMSER